MGDRLVTIYMGRKFGGCAPLGAAKSSCNTVWPRPRPTFVPWHLEPYSRLATTDMGRKWGGAMPLGVELGPHLTQFCPDRGLPPHQVASWSTQPFGHDRHGGSAPFWRGELGPYVTQCGLRRGLSSYQVTSWSIQPFGHNRYGPKIGGLCPLRQGRWVHSSSNTMWPGTRPTCVLISILIHLTVWPQYTNVTDRHDRQRSGRIGRTVLQTVARKQVNFSQGLL